MKSEQIKEVVTSFANSAKERGIKALDGSRDKINVKRKLSALEVIKDGIAIVYKNEEEHDKIRMSLSEAELLVDGSLITFVHCDARVSSKVLKAGNNLDSVDIHVGADQWVDFVRSFIAIESIINNPDFR